MCREKSPSPIITISDFFYFLKLFSKFGWSFISLWKHFLSQKCFLEKLSRMRPSCSPDLISRPLSSMAVELLWKTTGSRNLGTPMGFICFEWTLPDQYNWKNSQHPNGVAPCSSYYQRLGFSYLVAPPP